MRHSVPRSRPYPANANSPGVVSSLNPSYRPALTNGCANICSDSRGVNVQSTRAPMANVVWSSSPNT
jgi:hypothetical protein